MARPALRVRIIPKFPARIQGADGVSVTRTGGVVTIRQDWTDIQAVADGFDPTGYTALLQNDDGELVKAGLGPGATAAIASQAESEAGTNNTKLQTPLRTKQSIDVNAELADFTPELAVNFIRGIGDKLRDVKHIKDVKDVDPTGVADSADAINAAILALQNNGTGDLIINGGGRYRISAADLLVREGTTLKGPWRNLGERGGLNYSAAQGLLVNASRTIRLNGRSAGVEGLAILREGITPASTIRQAVDLANAFAGIAITFGDGATMNLASDGYVKDCFIAGFATGIRVAKNERPRISYVSGDNLTGVHMSEVYDMNHLSHVHFWPFLTARVSPASYAVSGAANNGSGLIRLTIASHVFTTGDIAVVRGVGGTTEANGRWVVTVINSTTIDLQGSTFANAYTSGGFAALSGWRRSKGFFFDTATDWGQADNCFAYGYDVGWDVASGDHGELVNCGADNFGTLLDPTPIGMRFTTCNAVKLIGPKTAAQGRGIVVDVGANRSITILGHDAWGNRTNNTHVVSGHATIIGQYQSAGSNLTGAGNQVDDTSEGVLAVGNKADSTTVTPIACGAAALRRSIIKNNSWVDAGTIGERDVTSNVVRNKFDADYSSVTAGRSYVLQKARGSFVSPAAVAIGDIAGRFLFQFWDGTSAFRDSATYRVDALEVASPTSAASRHVWGAAASGSVTATDRLALDAAQLYPISDNGLRLGATGNRFSNGFFQAFTLVDGITAPATITGHAVMYVDNADGDLKIKFGDGTVKTIVTDT